MTLEAGHKLAHYEILEPIGKGGMGEVYRAVDSKLGRDVAIKVLPDEFAQDEERLRRFQREAKVLASLNHPNIASIYGVEQLQNTHYLVLELVPGETLAEHIARGPIPVDEAIHIATEIAWALQEAHEQGIVHRDLKPANVKLTPDDKVKVLDFGLAKAFVDDTGDADTSKSPTITRDATRMGVILGTAAYMSPEQAKGRPVDKRTDVFAFGAILYEMLTGKKAFAGEDVSEVIASVIKTEPDWSALPDVPPLLRRVIRRCLEKSSKQRMHHIADARLEIEEASTLRDDAPRRPPSRARAPMALSALTGVVLGGLIVGLAVRATHRSQPAPLSRFAIATSDVFPTGAGPLLALSADGKTFVYSAERDGTRQLFLRARDQFEASPIPGTENATTPSLSPDGEWVAFATTGTIQKMPIAGGQAIKLCECSGAGRGITWGANDTLLFSDSSGTLSSLPAAGGESEVVTSFEDNEAIHRGASFLPGGRAILYTALSGARETARMVVQSLETGERRVLSSGARPRYVSSGHLLFTRNNALWAAAFDVDGLRIFGEAIPVISGVRQEPVGAAQYAVADDGTLAYLPTGGAAAEQRSLSWIDRAGVVTPLTMERRSYQKLAISPSGDELVLGIISIDGRDNIWLFDVERSTLTPRTSDNALNRHPVWSPDGTRIAFTGSLGAVYEDALNTSDEPRLMFQGSGSPVSTSWSPDGQWVAMDQFVPGSQSDVWILSVNDGTASAYAATAADESGAVFSPNGKWLAYESNESGRREVYVGPYPTGGRIQQVSPDGGHEPRWAASGLELFYLDDDNAVVAVPVRAGDTLELGQPSQLVQLPDALDYDVHPDGERFAVLQRGDTLSETSHINVVLNWHEELKRLVPTEN